MVQEILLGISAAFALGYLYYRFKPSPSKGDCGGDCGCSVKSEIVRKTADPGISKIS